MSQENASDLPVLLSICIPTFNRAAWLEASLAAWAEQSQEFSNVEIVVCDNASDDETPRITAQIAATFANAPLRIYRNSHNIGGHPNFLRLVSELAHGDWVWMVGDDDLPTENAIQQILQALENHPNAEFLYVPYQLWWSQKSCSASHRVANLRREEAAQITFPFADDTPRFAPHLRDLVGLDAACFTPIYCSVWRRADAVAAFEPAARCTDEPFASVESVSSHAVYVARNLLEKPAFYVGEPLLLVSAHSTSTWSPYAPLLALSIVPQIYEIFEENGAPRHSLDKFRRKAIRDAKNPLFQILTNPATKGYREFSVGAWFWKNRRFAATYRTVFRVALKLILQDFFGRRRKHRRKHRREQQHSDKP